MVVGVLGAAAIVRGIGGRRVVAGCVIECGGSVARGAAAGRSGVCIGRIGRRWGILAAARVVDGVVGCVVGMVVGWLVGRLVG